MSAQTTSLMGIEYI